MNSGYVTPSVTEGLKLKSVLMCDFHNTFIAGVTAEKREVLEQYVVEKLYPQLPKHKEKPISGTTTLLGKIETRKEKETKHIAPKNKWKAYTMLDCDNITEKEYLIDGLIGTKDIIMVYGESGSGKSFVVLDLLGEAVNKGRFADTFDVLKPLKVVYCSGEGNSGVPLRLNALASYKSISDEQKANFYPCYQVPQLFNTNSSDYVDEFIDAYRNDSIDLVVIDTLAWASLGSNENSVKDSMIVAENIKKIRDTLSCSVILIHHATKSNTDYRGSSALKAILDLQMKVSNGKLIFDKTKDTATPNSIPFNLVSHDKSAVVRWDAKGIGGNVAKQYIVGLLEEHSFHKFTFSEIQERIDYDGSQSYISRMLKELSEKGKIKKELKNPKQKYNGKNNPYLYQYC